MADLFDSYAKGLEVGQKQNQRNQLAELQSLGPQVMSGNLDATSRAYSLDPKTAEAYQKEGDRQQQQLVGLAKSLKQYSGNPQLQAGLYRSAVPYLKRNFGAEIPDDFDPETVMPIVEQVLAASQNDPRAAAANPYSNLPSDIQSLRILQESPELAQLDRERRQASGMVPKLVQTQQGIGWGTPGAGIALAPMTGVAGHQPAGAQQPGGFGIAETDNYVRSILGKVQVDPNATPEQQAAQLLPALIQQESGGNPDAVSNKGAVGLTQVMPATGANPGFGVTPLQNGSPEENVRFGREYLTAMLRRYPGRPDLALAAYNAGPGVADRFAGGSASAAQGIAQPYQSPITPYQQAQLENQNRANDRADQAAADAREAREQAAQARQIAAQQKAQVAQQNLSTREARLNDVRRGAARVKEALKAYNDSWQSSGSGLPGSSALSATPRGQELQAAVEGMKDSMLALTRVPGIGSQSDYEARIAGMRYPQPGQYEATNKNSMDMLESFVKDLTGGAELANREDRTSIGGASTQQATQSAPRQIQSAEEYNALPSGALFIAPDGTQRRKR